MESNSLFATESRRIFEDQAMAKKTKFPKAPKPPKTTIRVSKSGTSITRRSKVGNTTYTRTDSGRGTTFTATTRGEQVNTTRVHRVDTNPRKTKAGRLAGNQGCLSVVAMFALLPLGGLITWVLT